MRRIAIIAAAVLSAVSFVASASAQNAGGGGGGGIDPNNPDVQEMRDLATTMFQRIQDSGIDFQTIGQQMRDGTLDADALQQMLIDKGVLDDALVSRMQKAGTRLSLTTMKTAINASDEEWTVLLPKFERVVAAMMALGPVGGVGGNNPIGGGGGGGRNLGVMTSSADSPVVKALAALKKELADKDTTDQRLAVKLKEYRDARDKEREEWTAAMKNLKSVVTIRQEAILVGLGILD